MALTVHIARMGVVPADQVTGAFVDKGLATIKQMLTVDTDHRVLPGTQALAPSSLGSNGKGTYPTLEAYLVAEAVLGFKLYHLNQTTVITYNQ